MLVPRYRGLHRSAGFTLVELAVVLAIVALLLGSLMYTLSAQTEQRNFEETRRRLEQARELLLGYAIVNGRLPCPARSAATAAPLTVAGDEVRTPGTGAGTGCIGDSVPDYYGGMKGAVTLGLLPARAIGYQQVDSAGFAVDAWGNRLRYAVAWTKTNCLTPVAPAVLLDPHFVHAANMKNNGIACQPNDLLICKSVTAPVAPQPDPGASPPSCGGGGSNQIMSSGLVVAIIFSTGKNGATSDVTRIDEAANIKASASGLIPPINALFVSHTPTPAGAANGAFDDQFTWITVGELYGKLIAAGVLP